MLWLIIILTVEVVIIGTSKDFMKPVSSEPSEQFCLTWNDFEENLSQALEMHRVDRDFFDVTLACEGEWIQAHKRIHSGMYGSY